MKEKLINILKKLSENNSWDLALNMLNGIQTIQEIKPRYLLTIIDFLEHELKKSKDSTKIRLLTKARDNLKIIKVQEEEERRKENEDLENLLLEY